MKNRLLTINISHGTTHDGPGLRTTVFVKGCPLHCLWCQNPESIHVRNEVWWAAADCIGCGSCLAACPVSALSSGEKGIYIDRGKCISCGNCTEVCPTDAMIWQGKEYDMEKLLDEVCKDRLYYEQSGGGVTCSGGEPLLQYPFIREFFRRLKKEGISTALDTCGCVPEENLLQVLPYTDYILYDIKLWDSEKHKQFTGFGNERVLNNLLLAAEYVRHADHPMEIWIRTPLIPGATAGAENIRGIGTFLRDNIPDVLTRWELCAFNGACASKYERLDRVWPYRGIGVMKKAEAETLYETALSLIPEEKLVLSGILR